MNVVLVESLRSNGWVNLLGDDVLWCKNNVVFNVLLDSISGSLDGSVVNFKNHGDGVNVRLRIAERLAERGSIL